MSNQGLHVILRESNERTASAAKTLLEQVKATSEISVVKTAPFEAALKETYHVGITSKSQWILVVDADILVQPKAIDTLFNKIIKCDSNVFQAQGYILDYLTGQVRQAGPRFYNRKLLDRALNLIPNPGEKNRPEQSVVLQMKDEGFPSAFFGDVLGIHDYFQFHRDIYRKANTHGVKNAEIAPQLFERWHALSKNDDAFKLAIRAISEVNRKNSSVLLDCRKFPDVDQHLKELNISELPSLLFTEDLETTIDHIIGENNAVERHTEKQGGIFKRAKTRILNRKNSMGWRRLPLWIIGQLLVETGTLIKNHSHPRKAAHESCQTTL